MIRLHTGRRDAREKPPIVYEDSTPSYIFFLLCRGGRIAPLNDLRRNNIMVISEITFNGYFNFMRLPIYIITI